MKLVAMLFGKNQLSDNPNKNPDINEDSKLSQWTTFVFGILTLGSGIFGNWLLEFLFGYDFTIYPGEYLEKSFVYLLLIVAAFALYKGWVKERDLFAKVGHIELSFNAMITAQVIFFVGIIGYMMMIV
jgi:multicomponent Na+:H+ antiporter subunit D